MSVSNKHHVHYKIRIKLWVYVAIFLITLALSMIHYINGNILFYFPLGGFLAGIFIGFIVSRMDKFTWDKKGEHVVSKFDVTGLIILLAYLIFVFFKDIIIEDIIHVHNISSISLAVVSGSMLGRIMASRVRIKHLFQVFDRQTYE
jgi:hypothetical protein